MAEQDDARVQEIRARLEAATTDVVDELAGFRDFDGEWTANKTHRRRASPGGVRETFYAAGRISGLAEGDSAHADTAYLLARLDALTAERNSLVEDNTALRWENGDSYDTWPLARLREPEYFKVGDRELEKTAVCRCCDASWAWSYVSPDGYCLHCVDGRADLLAERDALAARLAALLHLLDEFFHGEESPAFLERSGGRVCIDCGVTAREDVSDIDHENGCTVGAMYAALAGSREQAV